MRPRHFGAVMSAMVTPFDDQGRLDLDAARQLARWLVAHGHDGLVVAGTTGEASTLSDTELCELVAAVDPGGIVHADAGSIGYRRRGTGAADRRHDQRPLRRLARTGLAPLRDGDDGRVADPGERDPLERLPVSGAALTTLVTRRFC